ncbi:10125_t:CDS:2 [Acaulospora colombiana]|uniref:10125_t:CDS:1 n=1 Tax=Acaulospora colombiana TaxID=27376 RepID=A0ACA9KHV9_9GLOM|nr:10125_t:CDS:2 [Acaulospora colombiana]
MPPKSASRKHSINKSSRSKSTVNRDYYEKNKDRLKEKREKKASVNQKLLNRVRQLEEFCKDNGLDPPACDSDSDYTPADPFVFHYQTFQIDEEKQIDETLHETIDLNSEYYTLLPTPILDSNIHVPPVPLFSELPPTNLPNEWIPSPNVSESTFDVLFGYFNINIREYDFIYQPITSSFSQMPTRLA